MLCISYRQGIFSLFLRWGHMCTHKNILHASKVWSGPQGLGSWRNVCKEELCGHHVCVHFPPIVLGRQLRLPQFQPPPNFIIVLYISVLCLCCFFFSLGKKVNGGSPRACYASKLPPTHSTQVVLVSRPIDLLVVESVDWWAWRCVSSYIHENDDMIRESV